MSNEEIYTIRCIDTKRSYPVIGNRGSKLSVVWDSQKSWFTKGQQVTIVGEDGRQETFIKN